MRWIFASVTENNGFLLGQTPHLILQPFQIARLLPAPRIPERPPG
jgi:hypothetical protein